MNTTLAAEIAPYLLSMVGFLLVYILYGIKSEIKEIRVFVGSLEGELRGGLAHLDRRLTIVETRCAGEHGHLMVGEH